MAYAITNPPKALVTGMGEGQPSLWVYTSTDAHAAVAGSGYFTNGSDLGLRIGDLILVSKSNATIGTTIHYVTAVAAGGAATVASATLA